jgi:hypothetical protein
MSEAQMSVDIPSEYTIDLTLDGGVTLDGSLDSNIRADVQLPTQYGIGITEIPKIQLGVDPVDLSLRLKEIPAIRAHLPANFKVGLSLLGMELLAIRLCGEAQVITEDYVANPCEVCGTAARQVPGLNRIDLVNGDG